MINEIYSLIKEIYERRVEIIIMLITTAITIFIGLYVISKLQSIAPAEPFSNISHVKALI